MNNQKISNPHMTAGPPYIYIYINMHVRVCVHMCVCTYVCMYVYIYVYICVCVCMCVCLSLTYLHTVKNIPYLHSKISSRDTLNRLMIGLGDNHS